MRRKADWLDIAQALLRISFFVMLAYSITQIGDANTRMAFIYTCLLLGQERRND